MHRILVVDDDEAIRQTLAKTLERAGYEVVLAVDGREAIRLFRTTPVDVAIVDIWMPEKDGLETLMEMRRHSPDARVIAMSGGARLGITSPLEWARRFGAKAILTKPFSSDELLATL